LSFFASLRRSRRAKKKEPLSGCPCALCPAPCAENFTIPKGTDHLNRLFLKKFFFIFIYLLYSAKILHYNFNVCFHIEGSLAVSVEESMFQQPGDDMKKINEKTTHGRIEIPSAR
jgi:hypothetical protein